MLPFKGLGTVEDSGFNFLDVWHTQNDTMVYGLLDLAYSMCSRFIPIG